MKSVNSQLKALSAIAVGMMVMAGAASAQSVVSGGATLPQPLYANIISNGPIVGTWSYTGTGSGPGKLAFLTNNPQATPAMPFRDENNLPTKPAWPTSQPVHIAGSDSALSSTELNNYNTAFGASFGPLIQVPAVATPVLLTYAETGVTTLNLSTAQICRIYSFQPSSRTWNQVTTAADDGAVGSTSAIEVLYRTGGSGTTELLSRFLNAACPSFLPAGKSFTVSNDFKTMVASALPTLTPAQDANADGLPDVWVGATGSAGVEAAAAVNHRLGYLSPSFSFLSTNNGVVARIDGFQPNDAAIQAALPAPPVVADRADPLKWVPAYSLPSGAYPILGTTNLLLGQCYADVVSGGVSSPNPEGAAVKNFLSNFNDGTYDSFITANHFVKLPAAWNTAIKETFLDASVSGSTLVIGDASTCNAIGRP
ncbi:substrate-binding domain-containing protein [Polaromonas sp. YR568]|uniref:substrate-binding domain-containing protein n=1 Tax=Polaromonas sp. YR568 TaxID=1855301 RepID=UPI00398C0FBE